MAAGEVIVSQPTGVDRGCPAEPGVEQQIRVHHAPRSRHGVSVARLLRLLLLLLFLLPLIGFTGSCLAGGGGHGECVGVPPTPRENEAPADALISFQGQGSVGGGGGEVS